MKTVGFYQRGDIDNAIWVHHDTIGTVDRKIFDGVVSDAVDASGPWLSFIEAYIEQTGPSEWYVCYADGEDVLITHGHPSEPPDWFRS